MNKSLLKKHIKNYIVETKKNKDKFVEDLNERHELIKYYQSFGMKKILSMNEDDISQYLSKLWAMLIWGNKQYVVDKIIEDKLGFQGVQILLRPGRLAGPIEVSNHMYQSVNRMKKFKEFINWRLFALSGRHGSTYIHILHLGIGGLLGIIHG